MGRGTGIDVQTEFRDVTVRYGDFDDDGAFDDVSVFGVDVGTFSLGLNVTLYNIDDGVDRVVVSDEVVRLDGKHTDRLYVWYEQGGILASDTIFLKMTHDVPEPSGLLMVGAGLCGVFEA